MPSFLQSQKELLKNKIMKIFLSTIIILLVFSSVSFGQAPDSTEFGHITKADIALKQYPNYSNASAVVLDDVGTSKFLIDDNNWSITIGFYRTTRIKIFTDAGISYAKVTIPFQTGYGVNEWVSGIEAATYNDENGQLVKTEIDPKYIYYEKVGNHMNVVRFVLPDVRKGSIIEYRYKLETNALYRLPSWHFQWAIPVLYSNYEVRMIPFFQYEWLLQGASSFDSHQSYVDHRLSRSYGPTNFYDYVHNYTMLDIPAFMDEDFVASVDDYIMKINFQLDKQIYPSGETISDITTWNDLVGNVLQGDNFGKYLKKSMKLSTKLMNMKKLQREPEPARFESVINYMKSHFKWNGDENWFATEKSEQFLEDKGGSAQDINLFAVGMLRAADINAYPVLISTRNHGTIKYNYPYIHFFNDVIILANIDGKPVLSDASSRYCIDSRIPIRDINDKGLIIKKSKGNVSWIPLNRTPLSATITENRVMYHDDSLRVHVRDIAREYDALELRNQFSGDPEALKKSLESDSYELIDSTVSMQNQNKRAKPFGLSYSFCTQPLTMGGKMYIAPFFNEIGNENMFRENKRTFPIDLIYPDKMEYTSILTIPSGYKIGYLPKPLNSNNDLYELNYGVKQKGNKLTITLEYYFKKAIYPASDYFRLKSFFAQVVKKGNEKIVLSKKAVALKQAGNYKL